MADRFGSQGNLLEKGIGQEKLKAPRFYPGPLFESHQLPTDSYDEALWEKCRRSI
jgi:hypothetical protein